MPVSDIMKTALEEAVDACAFDDALQEAVNIAWTRFDLSEGLPPFRAPSGKPWLMHGEGCPDHISIALGFRKTKCKEVVWLADPVDFLPVIKCIDNDTQT